jgi:hypothetical protein
MSTDVVDLAGLLYAALTGKWAGVSARRARVRRSSTARCCGRARSGPASPHPRRLCDELLNPAAGDRDVTATASAAASPRFLGLRRRPDRRRLAEDRRPRNTGPTSGRPAGGPTTSARPATRRGTGRGRRRPSDPTAQDDPEDGPGRGAAPRAGGSRDPRRRTSCRPRPGCRSSTTRTTRCPGCATAASTAAAAALRGAAGAAALRARPARGHAGCAGPPLRPGGRTAPRPEYWPFGREAGRAPAAADPGVRRGSEDDDGAGRSWLRLAALIAAVPARLVAVVIAFNLGRGKTPLGTEPDDDDPRRRPVADGARSPRPADHRRRGRDFDPFRATRRRRTPTRRRSAVDGNPGTAWQTSTYQQHSGRAASRPASGWSSTSARAPGHRGRPDRRSATRRRYSLYVTDKDVRPTGRPPAGSAPVRAAPPTARGHPRPRRPGHGRYLVLWLTSLPHGRGRFRGEVAEVVVHG